MTAMPIRIRARCIVDFPTIREHVLNAVNIGRPVFAPTPTAHLNEAVLVGSGPSVADEVDNIRKLAAKDNTRVFGIKAGHDFLLKNGITPDFGLAVDPQEKIADENFLERASDKVVYFIASQCHPSLFATLSDREVVVWHLQTNNLMKFQQEPDSPIKGHFMVAGGSTSGLRAMVLGFHMGFRKFHLFGYDSCLKGSLRKINGELCEKDTLTMYVENQEFVADKAMASQANEFQSMIDGLTGCKFKAYGEGLIQTICKQRYRQGAPDIFI